MSREQTVRDENTIQDSLQETVALSQIEEDMEDTVYIVPIINERVRQRAGGPIEQYELTVDLPNDKTKTLSFEKDDIVDGDLEKFLESIGQSFIDAGSLEGCPVAVYKSNGDWYIVQAPHDTIQQYEDSDYGTTKGALQYCVNRNDIAGLPTYHSAKVLMAIWGSCVLFVFLIPAFHVLNLVLDGLLSQIQYILISLSPIFIMIIARLNQVQRFEVSELD